MIQCSCSSLRCAQLRCLGLFLSFLQPFQEEFVLQTWSVQGLQSVGIGSQRELWYSFQNYCSFSMRLQQTNPNSNKFQQYIHRMSISRIRLNQIQPNNQSFSHQQSINLNVDSKSNKKNLVHKKRSRPSNFQRLKTDQRQSPAIFKNQALNSCAASMHLTRSAFSASKIGKLQKTTIAQPKKVKMTKQGASVINLTKNIEDQKCKPSSNTTKRKRSVIDFGESVKEKIKNFSVISTCVQQYVKEQRRNNSEVNLRQIIKIIGAFNRSEIAAISKPLEKLIAQIISSINNSLPQQKINPKPQVRPQVSIKSILKKSITFQSPPSEQNNHQPPTTKKPMIHREYSKQISNAGDAKRLQQNLNILKYQSNRLKYFLDEISYKNKESKKMNESASALEIQQAQKLEELRRLKKIADEQVRLINQLGSNSEQIDTFRCDDEIQ